MPDTFTEGPVVGDLVLFEEDSFFSRGTGTIAAAAAARLEIGTVLGRIAASGALVPWDPAAEDGSEVVAAVLIAPADARTADVPKALVILRHARLKRPALIWGAGVTDAATRAAGIDGLEALGILTDR